MKKPTAELFSKRHFQQYLRRQWAEKGYYLKKQKRVGVSIKEVIQLSAKRNSKIKTPYLDLWLAILDEFKLAGKPPNRFLRNAQGKEV